MRTGTPCLLEYPLSQAFTLTDRINHFDFDEKRGGLCRAALKFLWGVGLLDENLGDRVLYGIRGDGCARDGIDAQDLLGGGEPYEF